jgi:soluble lytic murein transglycosylase
MVRVSRIPLFLASFALATAAHAAQDAYEDTREAFKRAYAQVDADAGSPTNDTDKLRDYPLYPYLQAARLNRALDGKPQTLAAADERVEEFLARHGREPVTRELRRNWLASLADRVQWQTYLKNYRDASADDVQRCRSFAARIALAKPEAPLDEALVAGIAKQWLTPQLLPECEAAFTWLRAQNKLTPALVEQRSRLALLKGNAAFARQMAAMLPAEQAAPVLMWASMIEYPRRTIDSLIVTSGIRVAPEMLLDGWAQFVRKDRAGAVARYEPLMRSRNFDAKAASPYALALALALAWDRDPDALNYFSLADAADFDDAAREWQARAALWAQDWGLVVRSISSMSDANRRTARWRYWAARAAEQNKDLTLARQLYNSVLIDDNYYSAMAAARLEEAVHPHPEKLVRDQTLLTEIRQLPALVRARELLLCNLRRQADAEWRHGFETLSEDARNQAIHLASAWGWYDQTVATASQRQVFNDYTLLYPRPYDKEVETGARLTKLQPELIYGVLRQESLYRADAVSSAGARGLLQLLPETARHTARAWRRPKPSVSDLYVPSINVPLGAAQLKGLIDRFGGQTAVALAGYNAGPNAARRWLPSQGIDSDIWVENIPYNETRGYVQRVLWHSVVFAWLRSGEPQRTEDWLTRIVPTTQPIVLSRD